MVAGVASPLSGSAMKRAASLAPCSRARRRCRSVRAWRSRRCDSSRPPSSRGTSAMHTDSAGRRGRREPPTRGCGRSRRSGRCCRARCAMRRCAHPSDACVAAPGTLSHEDDDDPATSPTQRGARQHRSAHRRRVEPRRTAVCSHTGRTGAHLAHRSAQSAAATAATRCHHRLRCADRSKGDRTEHLGPRRGAHRRGLLGVDRREARHASVRREGTGGLGRHRHHAHGQRPRP